MRMSRKTATACGVAITRSIVADILVHLDMKKGTGRTADGMSNTATLLIARNIGAAPTSTSAGAKVWTGFRPLMIA